MSTTGRRRRIHIPNTIHHVMIRGNNRQRIFFNDAYFLRFLKILDEGAKKFDFKILVYCLMTNHVHLVIRINKSSLSDVMQNINYRYARWVNKKKNRIGHLFQGRYRSIEVNDDTYLINLCRYIHLNPVTAKIVKNVDAYPWSSHRNYTSISEVEWIDCIFVINAIQKKTEFHYHDFLNQPVDREKWKPSLSLSESGDIIINHDSVRELNKAHEAENKIRTAKKILNVESVSNIVCKYLSIDENKLYGSFSDRSTSKQRILLAYYWLKYTDIKKSEIAKKFHRTHGTLSRQLECFVQRPEKYFSCDIMNRIEIDLREI